MSGHSPQLSDEIIHSLPSRVSHAAQLILLAIGITSTIISIAGEWNHGRHFLNLWLVEQAPSLAALLNILLVALALFLGKIRELNDDVADPVVRHSARCLNAFCLRALTWFWRFLGLIYVGELYSTLVAKHAHASIDLALRSEFSILWPSALLETFSLGSTLLILLAYGYLSPKFLHEFVRGACESESRRTEMPSMRWRDHWGFWRHTSFVLLAGGLAVGLRLLLLSSDGWARFDSVPSMLNGVLSALAFAFFVGRMDSKFVLNWQWCIPLLFVYAGLQVFSPLLHSPNRIQQAGLFYAAFTMKCVLFIFLSKIFEERRILYYAVEVVERSRAEV